MSIPLPWRGHLGALIASLFLVVILFARDAARMATTWWNSSTYTHCLFIVPLVGWLVWQRRGELALMQPRAWWPGLMAIMVAGFVWIIGEAAGVTLVRHAALIMIVQSVVLTVLGPAIVRMLLFPIFYLVFLVPFGDEFIPAMQTLTARLTMTLLGIAHIKAVLDGVFITTPDGWFEVAEACSGVKFLVAMVAYGALVANVCFRRWQRRTAFMIFCIVIPVLANGIRAFATIYAAHLTDVKTATSFDHIVYGWVFFALVMALVMALAWRFFDRKPGDAWTGSRTQAMGPQRPILPTVMLVAAALLMPKLWDATLHARGLAALPNTIALPEITGWRRVQNNSGYPWVPRFEGADHIVYGRYIDERTAQVDLAIALYGWQGEGRKLVGFGQGAVDSRHGWAWAASAAAPSGAKGEQLRGPERRTREALTFYVIGGGVTGSAMTVKLRTLKARLTGSDQGSGVLVASAEGANAQAVLARFANALGPVDRRIDALLDQAKGR